MQDPSLKVSLAARKGAVLLLAVAAWLMSCYAEPVLRSFYEGSFETPHLPHVGNVPWFIGTDFFSSTGHLGVAMVIVVAVALGVEIAKVTSAVRGGSATYLAALGFQVVTVWAAFKHAGLEWPEHFVSLALTHGARPVYLGALVFRSAWPWPPMAALLILMGLTLFYWREPGATDARPRSARFRWVGSWGSLAWLGLAWLLGALARQATDFWIPASYRVPHLANVAAVPWDPAGEPQSTTVRLFGALFFAVLGLLLVEIVKALQIRRGRYAAYWPLLAFQVVLCCDVFASAAPDWAAYALSSVLRVPVPVEAFPSWPWISLLVLGLLLFPDFVHRQRAKA